MIFLLITIVFGCAKRNLSAKRNRMKIFSKNPTSPFTAGHVIIVITLKCHPYENGMAEYRMRKLKRAMFRILHRVLIGVNM